MIEFKDIRIRAALPLHPYLAKHPRLFLRLVADGRVCGDTAEVNGDLVSGVWDFKGKLHADLVEQALTIAVLTGAKGPRIQVVSVTLGVAEFLAKTIAFPNRALNFQIFDSSTPIQLKLSMTCSAKVSTNLGGVSQTVSEIEHAVGSRTENPQSHHEQDTSEIPSRSAIELFYADAILMPDCDEKASSLDTLGCLHRVLYLKGHSVTDLDKAISLHDKALQCTSPLHPQLAEHAHHFAIALVIRFELTENVVDIERAISQLQNSLRLTHDFDVERLNRLGDIGRALSLRFRCLNHPKDLEDAISNQQMAVDLMPDDNPDKLIRLSDLWNALKTRFERLGNLADIDNAISNMQKAVDLTADGHPDKSGYLNHLGGALQSRFDRLGSLEDLEDAISNHRRAVELMPDDHPDKPNLLNNLGSALGTRFDRLGNLVDLEDAISNQRRAVKLTPDGGNNKPLRLSSLGGALQSRFGQLGSLEDLEDAIFNKRRAVELTPDGGNNKPLRLSSLGGALQLRFDRLGSLEDLEDAISNHRQAVELMPDDHPDKPNLLNNLGSALGTRFDRLGNLTDLEDAISNGRRAVELMPDGHPDKPPLLDTLGSVLKSRFRRLGSLEDLEVAISHKRKAVELTPDGHPDKLGYLSNLGGALQSRFRRLGSLEDLEDAISNQRRVVELTPDGHPDKPSQLGNLGNALRTRFDRLGNLADLKDAISNQRKAVELMPEGHPGKKHLLSNLGGALQARFHRLGSLEDLEDAISNQRRAVELTPDDHPDKPRLLSNLGGALQSRFRRLGSLEDLEDAISNKERAVELTPDGHPGKPGYLSNLGGALQSRSHRLDSLEDLEDAISNERRAIELTPDGHPDKPGRLNNLGSALRTRFDCVENLVDLEDAISNGRRAVELMPDGHPDKPPLLNTLGSALQSCFRRLGNLEDLEDAISNQQRAVELTPDGHPGRPGWLYSLGSVLITRFDHLNTISDLDGALFAYSTAAKSTSGSAMHRFTAAQAWAKYSEQNSRSPLEAFSCAIDLLPRIAWLGLAVANQHALLADVGDVVRDAVAAAIEYEEYETAVVWAEQGRSIVWQNLLGLRSPVEDLRRTHPELANRLHNIARQLEGSGSQEVALVSTPITSVGGASPNHSRLAIEWDNLIEEIRKIPGFEGFLRAKSFTQLAPAAYEGPVVILNVNKDRCDALVLVQDHSTESRVSVISIPLERFSHEKSQKLFKILIKVLSSTGARERNHRQRGTVLFRDDNEAKLKIILEILWRDVVKPVIEGLAFQVESKRPPRIWWCATGALAFLPIHAAGLYDTQEIGEKLSDYVVSSYTPTLTAILELSDPVVREDFQVLTVAQASAPGADPIPKTEDEVKIVQRFTAGVGGLHLMREDATVECVRRGMVQSNWIHLACHGQQNPVDPMESGFLLHDKILKLSEIVKMSLPKADFAFLSACQTAMGDEKIAEESVHLAAGMLLSGCRGVIATTWSIRDEDAPTIAQEVYSRIFKDGKPNRKEAAYALHAAVQVLRDSGAQFVFWVPFIHIGR